MCLGKAKQSFLDRRLNLSMKIAGSNGVSHPLWNGKCNKFTQSFSNRMYEDTRIDSIRRKNRKEHIKHSLDVKEKSVNKVLNEMKHKNMIAKFFKTKFGVYAKYKELKEFSFSQLEKKLLLKGLHKKRTQAAVKIQTCYRGYRARKNYHALLRIRDEAARKI